MHFWIPLYNSEAAVFLMISLKLSTMGSLIWLLHSRHCVGNGLHFGAENVERGIELTHYKSKESS